MTAAIQCMLCGAKATAEPDGLSCSICGRYVLHTKKLGADREGGEALRRQLGAKLINFRWLVKERSNGGRPLTISDDSLETMKGAAPVRIGPLEPIDLVLSAFARVQSLEQSLAIDPNTDYLTYRTMSPAEFSKVIVMMRDDLKLIQAKQSDRWYLEPTTDGWKQISAIRIPPQHRDTAFVAMWFGDEVAEAWDQGFLPALEDDCHYKAIRIDREHFEGRIDDEILASIRRAAFVVADFTGQRGGVYFEAGFALGLGIHAIWTCRSDWFDGDKETGREGVHFDTNHYPFIVWKSPQDLRRKLAARVNALYPRSERSA